MIKRTIKLVSITLVSSLLLSSCYTYTTTVGNGAQGNNQTKKWNHYVVYGLAPVGVSDAKEMANGAKNYTVTTEHTFINGLVSALTFGLYSPTTTTVTK